MLEEVRKVLGAEPDDPGNFFQRRSVYIGDVPKSIVPNYPQLRVLEGRRVNITGLERDWWQDFPFS